MGRKVSHGEGAADHIVHLDLVPKIAKRQVPDRARNAQARTEMRRLHDRHLQAPAGVDCETDGDVPIAPATARREKAIEIRIVDEQCGGVVDHELEQAERRSILVAQTLHARAHAVARHGDSDHAGDHGSIHVRETRGLRELRCALLDRLGSREALGGAGTAGAAARDRGLDVRQLDAAFPWEIRSCQPELAHAPQCLARETFVVAAARRTAAGSSRRRALLRYLRIGPICDPREGRAHLDQTLDRMLIDEEPGPIRMDIEGRLARLERRNDLLRFHASARANVPRDDHCVLVVHVHLRDRQWRQLRHRRAPGRLRRCHPGWAELCARDRWHSGSAPHARPGAGLAAARCHGNRARRRQ